jgi:DNA-binding beta-propeller fold protein YncE
VIAEDIHTPNAMAIGPDGDLYLPSVHRGEVWQVNPGSGARARVLAGLRAPCAVKFDSSGALVVVNAADGSVERYDMRSHARTTVINLAPGLDNLAFDATGRMFVSSFADGSVVRVTADGSPEVLIAGGFLWPAGLACGDRGELWAADGLSLARVGQTGRIERASTVLQDGSPGNVRGVARASERTLWVTTAAGEVALYDPLARMRAVVASGLHRPMGVAAIGGGAVVAEAGAGRVLGVSSGGGTSVLASGLDEPTGVAVAPDGAPIVGEAGAGRVVRLGASGRSRILEGLDCPHGLAAHGGSMYVLDVGAKRLLVVTDGRSRTIASRLPVGAPRRVQPNRGIPELAMTRGNRYAFAGLAVSSDGTVYVAADGEGSVLAARPVQSEEDTQPGRPPRGDARSAVPDVVLDNSLRAS